MKKAVAVLEPVMDQEKALSAANSTPGAAIPGAATILLATVKGDVHDLGKNIVGGVLGCNGYTIKDLGVMVPTEAIVDAAQLEHAAVVGVSGLITPSLDEMVRIAREMEKRGLSIPLLVGGATTSLAHTALRIAPEYSGPVVHVQDAGQCPAVLRSLLSDSERPRVLEQLETRYREARARHDSIHSHITIIPLAEARANRVPASGALPWAQPLSSPQRLIELNDYPLEKLIPRIDWEGFLQSWELGSAGAGAGADGPEGSVAEAREKLLDDARAMLQRACTEKLLTTRGVVGLYPARAQGDDVVLFADAAGGGEAGGVPAGGQSPGTELARFAFLRSQDRKRKGAYNPCLADFVAGGAAQAAAGAAGQGAAGPTDSGWVGLFALSAGFGLDEAAAAYRKRGDDYGALLLATLANSLAEAFSEEAHRLVAGGAAEGSVDGAFGIRPAFGYPTCPDHQDKAIAFRLLEARQRCGLHLTESMMIQPSASVCGMYLPCPGSFYFSIAAVGEDQIADWARRKGIGIDEARQRIATMLPLVKKS
jgi:5-methyltetrahydrofolate--homocysteine methyltransferase